MTLLEEVALKIYQAFSIDRDDSYTAATIAMEAVAKKLNDGADIDFAYMGPEATRRFLGLAKEKKP